MSGLRPREHVTLEARTRDAAGKVWSASATYVARGDGTVSLAQHSSEGGSYSGVAPMGLFWSLRGQVASPIGYRFDPPSSGERVELDVNDGGRRLATTSVIRLARAPDVAVHRLTMATAGLVGELFLPPRRGRRAVAVVAFGGSGGGIETADVAGALASRGIPTLALAYFGAPGLPRTLTRIPLEYFARAVRWLARASGVGSRRVVLYGYSRGSEPALLLAAYEPDLVDGVVTLSPSDVVVASPVPPPHAAWTFDGRPIEPFVSRFSPGYYRDHAAQIPIERFNGNVFLVCGTQDALWPSCAMSRALVRRFNRRRHPNKPIVLASPSAGHAVADLVPYGAEYWPSLGGSVSADADARIIVWPRLVAFLLRLADT